jgi:hypothetical protein
MRVTNGIPLGCSLLLPVGIVNSVRTLKARHCGAVGLVALLTMNSAITTLKARHRGAVELIAVGFARIVWRLWRQGAVLVVTQLYLH